MVSRVSWRTWATVSWWNWLMMSVTLEVIERFAAVQAFVQGLARRGAELADDLRVRGAAVRTRDGRSGRAARDGGVGAQAADIDHLLGRRRDTVSAQLFFAAGGHPVGGPGGGELGVQHDVVHALVTQRSGNRFRYHLHGGAAAVGGGDGDVADVAIHAHAAHDAQVGDADGGDFGIGDFREPAGHLFLIEVPVRLCGGPPMRDDGLKVRGQRNCFRCAHTSPSPLRIRIRALQELHLGQDESQVLGVPSLLAAALHPGIAWGHGQRGFRKNLAHVREPLRAQFAGGRRDACVHHGLVHRVVTEYLAAVHPQRIGGGLGFGVAHVRAVAHAHNQVAAAAQVVRDFLERFFGDAGDAGVQACRQARDQKIMPGVEVKLPHHGVGVVAVGLLQQQAVLEIVGVAVVGQAVLVAARAFQFSRVRVPQARLPQQVERHVGQRHVFLQRRALAAQAAQLLAQDQGVVAQAQQRALVGRAAGHDVGRAHHPDAHALVAARVHVARVIDGHFGVRRMQAAHVLVRQAVLAADEHFPQRPLLARLRTHARLAEPRALLPGVHAGAQALAVARAVTLEDFVKFAPVDGAEVVVARLRVECQVGIGHGQAQVLGLRHGLIDHALAQFVVGKQLDAPLRRLRAVHRFGVRWPEHHQRRPPPAVQRILRHRLLFRRAARQRQHDVVALARMERLFLAHPDHGARIRPVRAAAQRDLVDDGRAVDQPADGAHVGPRQRGVIEDARILGFTAVQRGQHLVARGAQRFGGAVQVQAVARLVLDLGQQDSLALERGRARDPVAFGQLPDDFRVGVLRYLPDQGLAVGVGHPVLGLDADPRIDPRLEGPLVVGHLGSRTNRAQAGLHQLCVHVVSSNVLYNPDRVAGAVRGQRPAAAHGRVPAGAGRLARRAPRRPPQRLRDHARRHDAFFARVPPHLRRAACALGRQLDPDPQRRRRAHARRAHGRAQGTAVGGLQRDRARHHGPPGGRTGSAGRSAGARQSVRDPHPADPRVPPRAAARPATAGRAAAVAVAGRPGLCAGAPAVPGRACGCRAARRYRAAPRRPGCPGSRGRFLCAVRRLALTAAPRGTGQPPPHAPAVRRRRHRRDLRRQSGRHRPQHPQGFPRRHHAVVLLPRAGRPGHATGAALPERRQVRLPGRLERLPGRGQLRPRQLVPRAHHVRWRRHDHQPHAGIRQRLLRLFRAVLVGASPVAAGQRPAVAAGQADRPGQHHRWPRPQYAGDRRPGRGTKSVGHRAPAPGRDDGRVVRGRHGRSAARPGQSVRPQLPEGSRVLRGAQHEPGRLRARQPAHQRGRRQPQPRVAEPDHGAQPGSVPGQKQDAGNRLRPVPRHPRRRRLAVRVRGRQRIAADLDPGPGRRNADHGLAAHHAPVRLPVTDGGTAVQGQRQRSGRGHGLERRPQRRAGQGSAATGAADPGSAAISSRGRAAGARHLHPRRPLGRAGGGAASNAAEAIADSAPRGPRGPLYACRPATARCRPDRDRPVLGGHPRRPPALQRADLVAADHALETPAVLRPDRQVGHLHRRAAVPVPAAPPQRPSQGRAGGRLPARRPDLPGRGPRPDPAAHARRHPARSARLARGGDGPPAGGPAAFSGDGRQPDPAAVAGRPAAGQSAAGIDRAIHHCNPGRAARQPATAAATAASRPGPAPGRRAPDAGGVHRSRRRAVVHAAARALRGRWRGGGQHPGVERAHLAGLAGAAGPRPPRLPGQPRGGTADRNGAGLLGPAHQGVVADGDDLGQHVFHVARNRDFLDRVLDHAVFHPEARRPARIVAGDVVGALPHQFRDQQPGAQLAQHAHEVVAGGRERGRERQVVRAARVAGGVHAQLARGIRGQEVSLHHAVLDHVARARLHALVVERGRAHGADHVRVFVDLHVRRQHLPAERIDKKRGLAVQRAARRGLHVRAQQTDGQRRFKQYRAGAGGNAAGVQARQRAFGRVPADGLGRRHARRIAHRRVPVVALHVRAAPGDGRHRQRVARKRVAAHEAARVGRDEVGLLHVHARALAVGHARIDGKRGRFRALGQRRRAGRIDVPRIKQLQVGGRQFEQVGVRQPCAVVRSREAGDVVCGLHRGLERGRRKIGRAGVAAPLADVDGDAHALVAVLLDGFDLAFTYRHRQSAAFADIDRAIGAALRFGIPENVLRQLLQLFLVVHSLQGRLRAGPKVNNMVNPNRGAVGFSSTEFEQEYERPSKSEMKRQVDALQKLGEALVNEPRDRVKRVPMPEDVRDAILECQTITNHEGRRRQMQFVGKKMRTLDEAEIAAIQQTIDGWKGASKSDTAAMHALERRRDKLLADDKALTVLLEENPELDVQHLRTLIRNARKEQAENKPPKAYREIFQILKQRRRLPGPGHPRLAGLAGPRHHHAVPRGNAAHCRRARADRSHAGGAGRRRALPPGADHGRHRSVAARRHARSHAGRGHQGNAGLWRADAPDQPALRAHRHPVAPDSRDPRNRRPRGPDHEPAGPAQGDCRNAGRFERRRRRPDCRRHLCRRAVLHRPDRRNRRQPDRCRHLDARPGRRRQRLRADVERTGPGRFAGHPLHLPQRGNDAGHRQWRLRDAFVVRHRGHRPGAPGRRGGSARVATESGSADRPRKSARHCRRQDHPGRLFARQRHDAANRFAPEGKTGRHDVPVRLPADRAAGHQRIYPRKPGHPDLHGPRPHGPGRADGPRRRLARPAAAVGLPGGMARLPDAAFAVPGRSGRHQRLAQAGARLSFRADPAVAGSRPPRRARRRRPARRRTWRRPRAGAAAAVRRMPPPAPRRAAARAAAGVRQWPQSLLRIFHTRARSARGSPIPPAGSIGAPSPGSPVPSGGCRWRCGSANTPPCAARPTSIPDCGSAARTAHITPRAARRSRPAPPPAGWRRQAEPRYRLLAVTPQHIQQKGRTMRDTLHLGHLIHRNLRRTPPVVAGASGMVVEDRQGRRYLDASGGAAVSSLGHGHPDVLAAMHAQIDRNAYAHTAFFTCEAAEELAARLAGDAPGDLDHVYLVSGGSEAMETALKLARQYFVEAGDAQRSVFIARRQSYHGNTLGALAIGGNEWRRRPFAPLLMDVPRVAPCFEYRFRDPGQSTEEYTAGLLRELEETIVATGPERVIAFCAETVVGATAGARHHVRVRTGRRAARPGRAGQGTGRGLPADRRGAGARAHRRPPARRQRHVPAWPHVHGAPGGRRRRAGGAAGDPPRRPAGRRDGARRHVAPAAARGAGRPSARGRHPRARLAGRGGTGARARHETAVRSRPAAACGRQAAGHGAGADDVSDGRHHRRRPRRPCAAGAAVHRHRRRPGGDRRPPRGRHRCRHRCRRGQRALTGCGRPRRLAARLPVDDFLLLLAQAGYAHPHHVAFFQEARLRIPHAHAGRRARGDHVARFQRHELRQVADDLRHREDHGGRVTGLHALAVHFQVQVEVLHVADVLGRDQPRADRAERVAALALVPLRAAFELVRPLRHVVDHAVAGHVLERIVFRDVLRAGADDDPELHFPIGLPGPLGQHDRIVGARQRGDRLQEHDRLLGQRHLGFGRVVGVIEADADEFADMLDRHAEARRAAYQRQRGGIDFFQLAQRPGGQLRRIDVVDHGGQGAQLALVVDQARLFFAGAAVAHKSHDSLSGWYRTWHCTAGAAEQPTARPGYGRAPTRSAVALLAQPLVGDDLGAADHGRAPVQRLAVGLVVAVGVEEPQRAPLLWKDLEPQPGKDRAAALLHVGQVQDERGQALAAARQVAAVAAGVGIEPVVVGPVLLRARVFLQLERLAARGRPVRQRGQALLDALGHLGLAALDERHVAGAALVHHAGAVVLAAHCPAK
uniref:Putative aminotransferase n=1 Tax=Tanacetum cinerariifolium TaxID=118510 RepID=A0A699GLJ3_TANCI|nr:putative aminotransferase [Tanacetum cinerariifolium]